MEFNLSKCVHVTITNKRICTKNSYSIYGKHIHQASKAKYLGIFIDEHLTWKDHLIYAVEPRLSERQLSETSIIRTRLSGHVLRKFFVLTLLVATNRLMEKKTQA